MMLANGEIRGACPRPQIATAARQSRFQENARRSAPRRLLCIDYPANSLGSFYVLRDTDATIPLGS